MAVIGGSDRVLQVESETRSETEVYMILLICYELSIFFTHTATAEIYSSYHCDALPILDSLDSRFWRTICVFAVFGGV